MKSLFNLVKRFFFPPIGSPRWRRLLPYIFMGALTVLVLGAGSYGWEYTNSPAFCGTTCHIMPPEYTAYKISPHSNVACVECHLGRDQFTTLFGRKLGDIRHGLKYWSSNYKVPVFAESMLPSRDSCERCHWPAKFSDDKLRVIKHFAPDKANSLTTTYLALKTGGGTQREGLGRGIHWHIETAVQYIATDEHRQAIPWVRVINPDGTTTDYIDTEAKLPSDFAQKNAAQIRQVDCDDCHNRITHLFRSPDQMLDDALGRKTIDPGLPDIKRQGLDIFSRSYGSMDEAIAAIQGLKTYYQTNYPEYIAQHPQAVSQAMDELIRLYRQSVFPGMEASWSTHPDDIGHKDWPGCFRCHDGKHVTAEGKTIRLECNVCHTVPEIALTGQNAPLLALGTPPEPDSHKDTNWLFRHRLELNQTCAGCHDIKNAGKATNDSFCSNAACHGVDWKFAGLDAPSLLAKLAPLMPTPAPQPTQAAQVTPSSPVAPAGPATFASTIGPLLASKCGACHGDTAIAGLKLTDYASAMKGGQGGPLIVPGKSADSLLVKKQSAGGHPGQLSPDELELVKAWIDAGAPEAGQVQSAAGATPTATPAAPASSEAPPAIPHDLAGRDNCLTCHNPDGGVQPAPKDHAGRTNDTCQTCHKPAAPASPTAATATPAASVESEAPPSIPHDLAGRDNCLQCHNPDGGVKPAPKDHAGRTNDTCQACHKPRS